MYGSEGAIWRDTPAHRAVSDVSDCYAPVRILSKEESPEHNVLIRAVCDHCMSVVYYYADYEHRRQERIPL